MSYTRLIQERVSKYRQFLSDATPGQIMVNICPYTFEIDYACRDLQKKPFSSWDYDKQYRQFIERKADAVRYFMEYTKELDNDYIPAVSPDMGAGVNSGWFSGAEVIMGEDTSWVHPVILEWGDLGKLRVDESNRWVCLLKEMVRCSVDICDGGYVPGTFPHFGPGDMANALRGNELFYDIYDEPEMVHALMDKCADATIWLERELRRIAGTIEGGNVTANMWFPGPAPYLSEDFTDLCSADSFREFGFKYTQKMLDALGGAYIHHHAKGYHVHKEIAALKGLRTLEISLDPNGPKPAEHLEELFDLNGSVPLMIRCSAQDVYRHIEEMKKGRLVIMLNIDNLDEGREVMRFIRKNSRI
jgi:hypothetical protein